MAYIMQSIQMVNVNEQINDEEERMRKLWTTEKSVKMCTFKRELKEHLDKLKTFQMSKKFRMEP